MPFLQVTGDPDEDVQEQAFNVVRNLTESENGIAMVFKVVLQVILHFSSTILKNKRYLLTYYTCSLGSLYTRQHVEWNIRTTRSERKFEVLQYLASFN